MAPGPPEFLSTSSHLCEDEGEGEDDGFLVERSKSTLVHEVVFWDALELVVGTGLCALVLVVEHLPELP